MVALLQLVASHPIQKKPYHCIRFVRVASGVPLYEVTGDKRHLGAREALKCAFQIHGGHCFHCQKWFEPQILSAHCSRDHVRARSRGGGHHLHNLVITCRNCNLRKAAKDIVEFKVERGSEYLRALDEHITRCIEKLCAEA